MTTETAEKSESGRRLIWAARLALLFLAVTSCTAASLILYARWRGAAQGGHILVEGGDPRLSAAETVYLRAYLSARVDELARPVRTGTGPTTFVIRPGETANDVAANLQAAGLIDDTRLFLNYLRFYGLDSQLEAGTFRIDPQLSVADLAVHLTQAHAEEIELRFLEGWRVEEMAAYLSVTTPAAINEADFLAIAQRRQPFDLGPYDFLAGHPVGAPLEGYLFPDTYRVPLDADAGYLVDLMLRTFGRRVTPEMRAAYAAHGLTLHEAVTLASIVERETPLPGERPLVAAVFHNRLAAGMRLQADPTVQYAVGYHEATESWWKSPLSQADLNLDSPYNTYQVEGLPPGPIANPGLAALEAVARPAVTNALYFVADCGREGAHLFSETYEEHLLNVQRCR
ncbi:MAG: endolytic transglycosylase MltG [Candidatus Promineifilaceae bacterium]|nr:endolytic transglycosylase MltG [Candidatus Promineifilaceae bacterium]